MIPTRDLIRAINGAYSDYTTYLDVTLKQLGYPGLGGIAAAHKIIGSKADDRYRQFQAEQKQISQDFNYEHDADTIDWIRKELIKIRIHNVKSLFDSRKFLHQQANDHLQKMERGELAKYGVVATDEDRDKVAKLKESMDEAERIYNEAVSDTTVTPEQTATREQRIISGMKTYTGRRLKRNGAPWVRPLTKHVGMTHIGRCERNRLWDIVCQTP